MYLIEIKPEEKRIGITLSEGVGIEMVPNELRAIADAYEKEDWDEIVQCCERALSF